VSTAIKIVILENMGNPRRAYEPLRSQEEFLSMESVGYLNSFTFTQLRCYHLCQE
jgi:hypothetical protein